MGILNSETDRAMAGGLEMAVSADGILKSYGKNTALRGVSFEAGYGEIFGIIGPDGAGKSSLFRILTTLILPDSGNATVAGFDIRAGYREIRKCIGYMPAVFSLYQDMTVEENMNFFATLFSTSLKENYDLVKDIYSQIEPFKKRRAGALSGGMKQKLALSCALIHKPRVLFLDEPTTGVDPVSRKDFWDMLGRLRDAGLSIIVSTPYMDEATLCDRIALINDGTFLQIDTPADIIAAYDKLLYAVSGSDMPLLLEDLRKLPYVETAFAFGDKHHVTLKSDDDFSDAEELSSFNPKAMKVVLRNALSDIGHVDLSVERIAPTVEDCYMRLDTLRKIKRKSYEK